MIGRTVRVLGRGDEMKFENDSIRDSEAKYAIQ